jgi:hypothetical protein
MFTWICFLHIPLRSHVHRLPCKLESRSLVVSRCQKTPAWQSYQPNPLTVSSTFVWHVGSGRQASFESHCSLPFVCSLQLAATMLSVVIVDKAGRRPLLLAGVSGIVSAPLLPALTSSLRAEPADECWRSQTVTIFQTLVLLPRVLMLLC